jgi:hypothetical protein
MTSLRLVWSALFGRAVVATVAFALVAGLAMFARPGYGY